MKQCRNTQTAGNSESLRTSAPREKALNLEGRRQAAPSLHPGLRPERGRLRPCKQDKAGAGNPVSQLLPGLCSFRTSAMSKVGTVSSHFPSERQGTGSFRERVFGVYSVSDTELSWYHDNEAETLPSKVGEGREEEGWEAGRKLALCLFLQIKLRETQFQRG